MKCAKHGSGNNAYSVKRLHEHVVEGSRTVRRHRLIVEMIGTK
jgi:hypothetical protein